MADNPALEDRLCPGCKKSAVSEQGGLVVAFGQSFFHVDCFKCAKCGDQVTADTNLLLLSDGSPICANCSYNCNVCHLPILDEAIMTGDDSYHAHCFKCKVCKSRIDDLVFAKTSQGIYCMDCHSDRMIKIRKHTQKKAEREKAEKERIAGGSGSTKSRERDARNYHRENGTSSPALDHPNNSHLYSSTSSRPSSSRGPNATPVRSPAKSPHGPYVSDAFASSAQIPPSSIDGRIKPPLSTYPSNQSFSVTIAPPAESEYPPSHTQPYPPRSDSVPQFERPNPVKQSTLPIPNSSVEVDPDGRRRSYDDGVRPLNVLFGNNGDAAQQVPDGQPVSSSDSLNVVTSRRDKRRSINPALSLSDFNPVTSGRALSPTLSPRSTSVNGNLPYDRTPTPPTPGGRESPHTALSPLRETFHPRSPSSSRPTSHGSSHQSHSSLQTATTSPPQSEEHWHDQSHLYSEEQSQDQTIVVKSPPSSVTLGSVPPKARAKAAGYNGNSAQNVGGPQADNVRLSGGLSPQEREGLRTQRSFDDRQHSGSRPDSGRSYHSLTRSRSVSPAYQDVPQNVESETESDPEAEGTDQRAQARDSLPPAPPPKDHPSPNDIKPDPNDIEPDSSVQSHLDSGSEELSDSSPVEHTSHSTFIAPALPPIRISMNTADFSELFNSVGAFPSLKSLDRLAKIQEATVNAPFTPPPTANFEESLTPRSNTTITPTPPNEVDASGRPEDVDYHHALPSSAPSLLSLQPKSVFSQLNKLNGSEPHAPSSASSEQSTVVETNGSLGVLKESTNSTRITLTEPDSAVAAPFKSETTDLVVTRLQEAVIDARERGAQQLKMDRGFVEAILSAMAAQKAEFQQLKSKFDGAKRTSKQYIEGLTVAQTEYDRELKARRDAEAEVTRLRVLLSGQVARLTAMSGDSRRTELRQQLSKELNDNLSGLEQDLSNLKVERDMAMAEVEELSATKGTVASSEAAPANLGRTMTKRLDSIKGQYKRELVPLKKEREGLTREIAELKAVRDVFLEETTVLNARNEELAQLSAVYSRRMESIAEAPSTNFNDTFRASLDKTRPQPQPQQHPQQHQQQTIPLPPSLSSSTSGSSTIHDDSMVDTRYMKMPKQEMEQSTPSKGMFRKWPGTKAKEVISPPVVVERKARLEHNFQQLSVLRFTRCDHCGDKMWGSQLRCTACPTSIHVRCVTHIQTPCAQQNSVVEPESPPTPLPPSMFGRDLVEQVHADCNDDEHQVPVIVEKCIDAVESLALDYEGIYRKTGGSGQSKAITQLFERGDYSSFDLRDSDRFNDICSVTSVLKNYFRSLPVPLLTFDLHDEFMHAVHLRDQVVRQQLLLDLVNRLPDEHYYTLRMLMLHLNRVRERCDKNLMNARNLGVVFGPTLMRSRDPGAEFSDMAGKALSIEWLVENAPLIFKPAN
ncbi:putative Rho-type GTPase-activating protein 3 [Hypsizygus marmoreus]|uniref:Rho-type GTPase-activating protein 3 n=1 Tax=Hypsizygus marmoreus TaxID=39966 RepID=A0A369J6M0_HYPMA|nr:putative Rho-type GTPase-activating protein 3 [Hypsizygus marmoreus]